MPQPPVGEEGRIEEDGRDDAAGDEERLEPVSTGITDVRDGLVLAHTAIVHAVLVDGPVEQQAKEGGKPYDARYYGQDPV